MRPFRVALLLQMRNLQRNAYLQGEKDVKDEKYKKVKPTEIKTEQSL